LIVPVEVLYEAGVGEVGVVVVRPMAEILSVDCR
jgi:hypothetical protein